DRYLVPPLAPDLKGAMTLSDEQLGWLWPAFMLVYMLTAPVFGAWGDRGSRRRPIALGVLLWSLATVPSGLARDYAELLGARAPAASGAVSDALARYLSLLRRGPYMLIVLGYAAYTFALGGLGFWMPLFLERVRAVPPDKATTGFGAIVVVTGVLGTLVGGWLGDYCLERSRQGYLWFSGVVTLAAVPFAIVALAASAPAVYTAAVVAAELLLFMSTGPINAAIANIVSPLERASALALSMFAIHLLGDVP